MTVASVIPPVVVKETVAEEAEAALGEEGEKEPERIGGKEDKDEAPDAKEAKGGKEGKEAKK